MFVMMAKCNGHELCERCIGCGKDREYPVEVCDKCRSSPMDDVLYEYGDKVYCIDCLLEVVPSHRTEVV